MNYCECIHKKECIHMKEVVSLFIWNTLSSFFTGTKLLWQRRFGKEKYVCEWKYMYMQRFLCQVSVVKFVAARVVTPTAQNQKRLILIKKLWHCWPFTWKKFICLSNRDGKSWFTWTMLQIFPYQTLLGKYSLSHIWQIICSIWTQNVQQSFFVIPSVTR